MVRHKVPKNSHPALWDKEQFTKLWFSMSYAELSSYLHVNDAAVWNAVHRFGLVGAKTSGFHHPSPSDGTRHVCPDGYIQIYKEGRWQFEHRWVMEQALGQRLQKNEVVHHINGDRADNRRENLEVLSPTEHWLKSSICQDCSLRTEIRLLRWEVKQLCEAVKV